MRPIFKIFTIILIFSSCQVEKNKRETILDNISHIEDSIHYQIDSLSSLCEELGFSKKYIDIGDCRLYCETEGKGIPMILIHGGPGGTHHYFHPWFSQASDFCEIIYYDQRGCGKSDFVKGEDGYSFKQAVDDLEKLRQKLGIGKWIVSGYSYGGTVAQYYSATYPENVLGMVLIGSSPLLQDDGLNGSRQYDYISEEEKQKIKEIYKLYRNDEISFLQLLYNKEINGDWKRQNFYKPTKEEVIRASLYEWVNDKGFNRTMSSSFGRYNFEHVFDNCPIPTLLCEGEWDLTWSAGKKDIFKKNHPNAQFVLFENSGHNIFYDESDLFFSTLKKFVKRLKPASDEKIDEWKKQSYKLLSPQEKLFNREARFFKMIATEGIDKATEYYTAFKFTNKEDVLFSEIGMNSLGYSYLRKKEYEIAIKLFEMNVEAFPDSWNTYDSLGEAYLANGDKEKAIENYKKSIELNPDNENGIKILNEIQI